MTTPLVTVGMMVHNEANDIEQTLASWLGQTCNDFRMLIVDNGSTDGTPDLIRRCTHHDPRVTCVFRELNEGAYSTVAFLFEQVDTPYFALAGGHDQVPPDYLERLVAILEQDPSVVLAAGRTALIDGNGVQTGFSGPILDTRNVADPLVRLGLCLWCDPALIHGVIRSAALQRVRFERRFFAAIWLVLLELALQGCFAVDPELIWLRRQSRQRRTRRQMIDRYYSILFPKPRPALLPHWNLFHYMPRSIWRQLPDWRLRLRAVPLLFAPLATWGRWLAQDLLALPERLRQWVQMHTGKIR